jgi:hypothetical protein
METGFCSNRSLNDDLDSQMLLVYFEGIKTM